MEVSLFFFFLLVCDVVTFLICLSTLVVEQTESEEDSSEKDSWTAKEVSGDDETVLKGFETIDPEERYTEVSILSENFSSTSVGNIKKFNITKYPTFMVYDYIHDKK